MTTTKVESRKSKVENQHTPGPWKAIIETKGASTLTEIVSADTEWPIAHVYTRSDKRTTDYPNARLIAAAPDLLKELKHLLRFFGPDEEKGLLPSGLATLNGARAAIAKAEGRAS